MSVALATRGGHPQDKKAREKLREAKRAFWTQPARKQQLAARMRSQWNDPVYRARMLATMNSDAWRRRRGECAGEVLKALWEDPAFRDRQITRNQTRVRPPAELERIGRKAKARNLDLAYRERVERAALAGLRQRPTKPEQRLRIFLDQWHPGIYRYVGDGQLVIGGKCPDFVGGRHLIELFGRYWHGQEEVEPRRQHFARHGYRMLVIWDDELKQPRDVRLRIERFTRTTA